jgi:hypothetical protein
VKAPEDKPDPDTSLRAPTIDERLAVMDARLARIEGFCDLVMTTAEPWLKAKGGRLWLGLLASRGGK